MANYGLLIDYEWCTGCHSCEIACKNERALDIGEWGIKLETVGPYQYKTGEWEHLNIAIPTMKCDLCSERVAKGEKPSCVLHCLADVLRYGTVEELNEVITAKGTGKCVIFVP